MNPSKTEDLQRLRRSVEASRRKLEPFRSRHRQAVEQYVGVYYSDDAAQRPVHVNLMELAAQVYERNLSARPPQALVLTRNRDLRPVGVKYERMLNEQLIKHRIHTQIQRCVKQALFSVGICKVGVETVGEVEVQGYKFAHTEPFVRSVLLDDWVHDMSARHMEEVAYCGHRYRVRLSEAKKNKQFKKSVRDKLRPEENYNFNEQGGDERIGTLASGSSRSETSLEDTIELWEIWLPRERKLVTLSTMEDEAPLRVVDWDGPDRHLGPFHMLWFNEVDGNTMPLAPAMLWQGLHQIVNGLYRKLERQANRVKHIGVTRGADAGDAERIRQTSDGEIVAVDNPDAVQEKSFGGIDQRNFAFMLQSRDLFSWLAGNLDALGGLGPQSETVGQDKLLFAAANQRIAGMQDRVMEFTRDLIRDFGYHLWQDPLQTYPVTVEFEGIRPLEMEITPDDRRGHSVYEHEVEIEAYSMQHQSPGERLQTINQIVQGIVVPAMPLLQQQGMQLNMAALMDLYSKYANLPELKDLVQQVHQGPPEGMDSPGSDRNRPRQAPVTTRENVRVNRPGHASRQNADSSMISQLMSGTGQTADSLM